jgi:hypothetical protein
MLKPEEVGAFEEHYAAWEARLMQAGEDTRLPAEPDGKKALNDLLIELRLGGKK